MDNSGPTCWQEHADFEVTAWSHAQSGILFETPLEPVELGDCGAVERAFQAAHPEAVMHLAAMSRVESCFHEPALAERINRGATSQLARLADARGARLVYASTDMVFAGDKGNYTEADTAEPLSHYGRTKLRGEEAVLEYPRHAVARLSLLFGPSLNNRLSFFDLQLAAIRERHAVSLFVDEWRTPLDVLTASRALIDLAVNNSFAGRLHIGGPQRMSRWEMGRALADWLQTTGDMLHQAHRAHAALAEPRPRDLSLDSARWRALFPRSPWPAWPEALATLLQGDEREKTKVH
jgi:dTDP-4-dehydrorhamnose reductase